MTNSAHEVVDASSSETPPAPRAGRDPRPQTFRYRAFITYSRHDRRTAEWLHKSLEGYRIPKDLVGQPGRDGPIPKRIFPVFRDRDELPSAANLSTSIREALEQSAYLIVLCSPSATRSRWVNREILEFKKLSRGDRIHALIVSGEPNAQAADQECYPPALRFDPGADGTLDEQQPAEPLAADLRPEGDGKNNAKLKLIAGLLDVPFNSLRQREVVAARRRLLLWQAVAGSILLLLALSAAAIWYASIYYDESVARQIPGIRIERRETVLDLSGWQQTTDAELSTVKKSQAISYNKFSIVRTHLHARKFIHVAGTSSAITPEVRCNDCKQVPRPSGSASRAPNEWNIEFDISGFPLDEKRDVAFSFHFWNAFQKPREWGGFRVLHATKLATYSVRFPEQRRPLPESLAFSYVNSKEHPFDEELRTVLVKDAEGRVKEFTWEVQFPSADRSYRVRWDW